MSRPEGSIETVESLAAREQLAWLKLSRRLRSVVEKEVKFFEKEVDSQKGLSIEGHIKISDALRGLVETVSKCVAEGTKVLKQPPPSPQGVHAEALAESDLLSELRGGKG